MAKKKQTEEKQMQEVQEQVANENLTEETAETATISPSEFKDAIAKDYSPFTEQEWRGLKIRIRKNLSFNGMIEFVNSVVKSCFTVDTGEYIPEIKPFSIRVAVIEHYTDIVLPTDMKEKYDFVYGCDIAEFVIRHIDGCQYYEMLDAINGKLAYKADSNVEAITKKMNELTTEFASLGEKLSEVFDGIDGDTISAIAGAVVNGNFDEAKLVDAYAKKKTESKAAK